MLAGSVGRANADLVRQGFSHAAPVLAQASANAYLCEALYVICKHLGVSIGPPPPVPTADWVVDQADIFFAPETPDAKMDPAEMAEAFFSGLGGVKVGGPPVF